jgi:hypothetical protein
MILVYSGIGLLKVRRANWRIGVISLSTSSMAVAQGEPVLQQINAQHGFHHIWVIIQKIPSLSTIQS